MYSIIIYSDNYEHSEVQRKTFLEDLIKIRERQLEENRKKRAIKKNNLDETHAQLYNGDNSRSIYDDYDSIADLINETEGRIPAMEETLRKLKSKYSSKTLKQPSAYEMRRFKLDHKNSVAVAEWIIDIVFKKFVEETSLPPLNEDTSVLVSLLRSDKHQYDLLQEKTKKFEATLGVMEALIEEVVDNNVLAIADEVLYLSKLSHVLTHKAIMNSAKEVSDQKQNVDNALEQAWFSLANQRNRLRKDVWAHTLPTVSTQPKVIDDPVSRETKRTALSTVAAPAPAPPLAEDLPIVTSEGVPFTVDSKHGKTAAMKRYKKKEREWWTSQSPLKSTPRLVNARSVSITMMRLSIDHQLLAVGTGKGDVLVYDLTWRPFRLIRCAVHYAKKADPIKLISWSLDKTRLLTLSATGCVILWSVSFTLGVQQSDLDKLGISIDQSFYPFQLTCLCVFENEVGDFMFKEGPLAESETSGSIVTDICFDRAMSLAATQDHIIVVMQSGDFLRCDLSKLIENRFRYQLFPSFGNAPSPSGVINGIKVETESSNKISNGIPCELFRWHRCPIILTSFIKDTIVTIDSNFNVCTWIHNSDNLNSFGWFAPVSKRKIMFAEEILVPSERGKVLFEDDRILNPGITKRRKKTKQAVERERLVTMRELRSLQILKDDPWYTNEFPDKLENPNKPKKSGKLFTRIYSPPDDYLADAANGGATFYEITYRAKDEVMAKCISRLYETSTHKEISVLKFSLSSYGDRTYFMLLFNEYLPKVRRHISIIDFDMKRQKLGTECHIKIDISTEDFNKCYETGSAISFSVSRVNCYSGASYIACVINRNFYIYSAGTGKKCVQLTPAKAPVFPDVPFAGVNISGIRDYVFERKILFANANGPYINILLAPSPFAQTPSVPVQLITFNHVASTELQLSLRTEYENVMALKELPDDASIDGDDHDDGELPYELSYVDDNFSHRDLPLPLYMQMILYRILDVVIAKSTGLKMNQDTRRKLWRKDWERMQGYFKP